MDQGGVTWVVTADAVEARVFTERVRAGPLKEVVEFRLRASDDERSAGRGVQATFGPVEGRRAAARAAERRFLKRVATRLAECARKGDFDRLALMGPPHALGTLRRALPPTLAVRVDVSDAHERRRDDAEELRRHLRDARARTWTQPDG